MPGTPSFGPAVFLECSIELPADLKRVKLLLDHDSSRPVGYLQKYGFAGEIWPVNPRYDTLQDLRCFPSLDAIGKPVDLVLRW